MKNFAAVKKKKNEFGIHELVKPTNTILLFKNKNKQRNEQKLHNRNA